MNTYFLESGKDMTDVTYKIQLMPQRWAAMLPPAQEVFPHMGRRVLPFHATDVMHLPSLTLQRAHSLNAGVLPPIQPSTNEHVP